MIRPTSLDIAVRNFPITKEELVIGVGNEYEVKLTLEKQNGFILRIIQEEKVIWDSWDKVHYLG